MGPGVFTPGRRSSHRLCLRPHPASMGPGVFTPGRRWRCRLTAGRTQASMGPGVFTPGRPWQEDHDHRTEQGFNGAGRFHARKAPTRCVSGVRRRCFNGAGRFHARKERELLPRSVVRQTASMGPGVFTPGRVNSQTGITAPSPLQWGRAFSRPEGLRELPVEVDHVPVASMGPGVFTPGRRERSDWELSTERASMGPGVFTPGRHVCHPPSSIPTALQWGRAFSRPEGNSASAIVPGGSCGFNGAGRFHARKEAQAQASARRRSCFNGAGRFHARKGDESQLAPGP